MTMTKQHYETLAEAIKEAKPQGMRVPVGSMRAWEDVITEIARALAADNDRFDTQRFRDACGVEEYR